MSETGILVSFSFFELKRVSLEPSNLYRPCCVPIHSRPSRSRCIAVIVGCRICLESGDLMIFTCSLANVTCPRSTHSTKREALEISHLFRRKCRQLILGKKYILLEWVNSVGPSLGQIQYINVMLKYLCG